MILNWLVDRLALLASAALIDLGLYWLVTHPLAVAGLQLATIVLALIARVRLHHQHQTELA